MASNVYSTRFLLTSAIGVTDYTVPPLKLAVVKFITVSNGGATAAKASLIIEPAQVWITSIPAVSGAASAVMLVLYAGEKLGLFLEKASMSGTAAGFLFNV